MLRVAASSLVLVLGLLGNSEGQKAKPRLDLEVTPHALYTGKTAQAIAKLKGIVDHPEFECPEVRWSWGDGSESVGGDDCSSPEPTRSSARQFSSEHSYNEPGDYRVEVSITPRKGSGLKALATVTVRLEKLYMGIPSPLPH